MPTNAIEDVLSATADYLENTLADDKAAQEACLALCANDQHPYVLRPLKCLPGHTARIEIARSDF